MDSSQARRSSSLAQSALWLIFAKSAAFALNIAVPLVLVRRLTVHEFGIYKQLFLLVDTAVVILPLGFALTAFYFFPRDPTRKGQVVRNILLAHVLMGAAGGAVVSLFPTLPARLLNSPDLVAYAPTIGVVISLWVGTSFIEFVAIANGEARLAALVLTAMWLVRGTLFVITGVVLGSVRAVTFAAAAHGLVQVAMMIWYIRARFPVPRWTVDWALVRAQLAYALPLAYAGILWWFQGNVHHYFVSNRYDATAYAIYAVGCFSIPLMGILQESVAYVTIRRVSELRSRNAIPEIVHLAVRSVRMLAAVAFPVYGFLMVAGREFLTVLFTQRYQASWPIFAVNLTLIPLSIAFPACDAVFRSSPEHLPYLATIRTVLLVPLVGGLLIATKSFGLVAPIAVVVGVTFLDRVLSSGKVARILRMSWSDLRLFGDVVKLGAAAGVAGLITLFVRLVLEAHGSAAAPFVVLTIGAAVFGFVYLGMVFVFGVVMLPGRDAIRHGLARAAAATRWHRTVETPERGA